MKLTLGTEIPLAVLAFGPSLQTAISYPLYRPLMTEALQAIPLRAAIRQLCLDRLRE